MRVLAPKPVPERVTTVELTDYEIALIRRALLEDETPNATGSDDENAPLFAEFMSLMDRLNIEPL